MDGKGIVAELIVGGHLASLKVGVIVFIECIFEDDEACGGEEEAVDLIADLAGDIEKGWGVSGWRELSKYRGRGRDACARGAHVSFLVWYGQSSRATNWAGILLWFHGSPRHVCLFAVFHCRYLVV